LLSIFADYAIWYPRLFECSQGRYDWRSQISSGFAEREFDKMVTYGPVPSRRLGRSIGINNIPPKTCSYACVYCQLGRTTAMTIERSAFHPPSYIYDEVEKRVTKSQENEETIDYLTFVPDGEPTLDLNLETEIRLVSQIGYPIAVLTNASLLWQEGVRDALRGASLVSLKIDAISEALWRRVDRPHGSLSYRTVLDGIQLFAHEYEGIIVTETMLVDGIDYTDEMVQVAEFLTSLSIDKAFIAIPTRPPALDSVRPAKEETVNRTFQSFAEAIGSDRVELLIGYEGNAFAASGDLEQDLLSITSVHPMREDAVRTLVEKSGSTWNRINELIQQKKLIQLTYNEETFFMRRLPCRN
jgi:wyosine [tRNA(Phe)-imidazoG37] synthetase (radical SAM superfamily)